MSALRAPCPRCGKLVAADEERPLGEAFPFCSERCRLLDLGKWLDEEYRVEGKAPGGPSDGAEPPDGG